MKLLLENGADIDDVGNDKAHPNGTPLMRALLDRHDHVAQLLIKEGARVLDQKRNSLGSGIISHALHVAAVLEHEGTVKLLLQRGVDVDVRDCVGRTALHWVTQLNHPSHENLRTKRVKLLLEYHADPNARDFSGLTPKDLARRFRSGDLLYLLSIPPQFIQKPRSTWHKDPASRSTVYQWTDMMTRPPKSTTRSAT